MSGLQYPAATPGSCHNAWAAWHFGIFFHSIGADALFAATAVALSILMTVFFLRTRVRMLLAIVMHGSIIQGREIAQASCPTATQPPDSPRAAVAIAIALIVIAITHGNLGGTSLELSR